MNQRQLFFELVDAGFNPHILKYTDANFYEVLIRQGEWQIHISHRSGIGKDGKTNNNQYLVFYTNVEDHSKTKGYEVVNSDKELKMKYPKIRKWLNQVEYEQMKLF